MEKQAPKVLHPLEDSAPYVAFSMHSSHFPETLGVLFPT